MLSDDEPRPEPQLEARRLSLDPRKQGRKHRRDDDSMSVESTSHSKKPDQTRSSEKRK